MTPLLGFLPDVDDATPGAILAAQNIVPASNGIAGAPSAVTVAGVPVLAAECRNAAVATKLDGTRRIFAGTASNLYELDAGSWVSRASGFSLSTDTRWDFAQFGDSTLAAAAGEPIQRSTSTTFSAISGAPEAMAIEVASGFVMAVNTDAGSDVWHCSALLDETDWTPALATQSATGRLVSTPGAITAAKGFGEQIAVYKDRSIYLGRYVGTPAVWEFDLIPGDVGCVGLDAVTDLGGLGHAFVGRSDIMLFDGTRPVSIAEGSVRQFFFNDVNPAYLFKTVVLHDKQNSVVWFFYPSVASTVCDKALVYHMGTRQWGTVTQTIECALNYVSAGATIGTVGGNIEDMPDVSIGSQYWLAGGRMMTVFTSAHQLSTMNGISGASSMTLFDVGDDQIVSRLSRLRVGYQLAPTSATVSGQVRMSRGEGGVNGGSGIYANGKFDIRQSGRFHRLTVDAVGSWVAAVVDFDFLKAGNR
jgi:hypothetical protein